MRHPLTPFVIPRQAEMRPRARRAAGVSGAVRSPSRRTVLAAIGLAPLATVPAVAAAPARPRLISLRGDLLDETAARLRSGDARLRPALDRLLRDADEAMTRGPFTVTEKSRLPPSGDRHDYFSRAPYHWPDPAKPDGLPYIRRDGLTNPEAKRDLDQERILAWRSALMTLALAHRFGGKAEHGRRAATLIRVFLLDPKTRMNPHLKYAQGIPGVTEGRGTGIIDTRFFVDLVDAIAMLGPSSGWTARDQRAVVAWMKTYLTWLRESSNGRDERAAENNHGSWYDTQVAAIALFTGQAAIAREVIEGAKTARIDKQFEPDGSQPLELARTRSLHYSAFNLDALARLAEMGRRPDVGVDLWGYVSPRGASIYKGLDSLAPYADPARRWPGQQVVEAAPDLLVIHLLRAERARGDGRYAAALEKVPQTVTADHRALLLYPPRAAAPV